MATRYVEHKAKRTGGVRNPETPASRKTNRPSSVQIKPGDMGSSYTKANEIHRNRGGNMMNSLAFRKAEQQAQEQQRRMGEIGNKLQKNRGGDAMNSIANHVRKLQQQGLTQQQAQENVRHIVKPNISGARIRQALQAEVRRKNKKGFER